MQACGRVTLIMAALWVGVLDAQAAADGALSWPRLWPWGSGEKSSQKTTHPPLHASTRPSGGWLGLPWPRTASGRPRPASQQPSTILDRMARSSRRLWNRSKRRFTPVERPRSGKSPGAPRGGMLSWLFRTEVKPRGSRTVSEFLAQEPVHP